MTEQSIVPSISLVNGRPATTSLKIAEHFGKRHDNIVRDIRKLCSEILDEIRYLNFEESTYLNEQGKELPMFTVYFDGFILLAMGYTGKKALQIKLAYITAFNAMRKELEERKPPAPELPSADTPLTPDQQCTLQAIVRAKVEALPLAQQNKGSYPKVWSRFNNHFRIARYSQLPQSRMSEAVTYLTRMEVLPPAQEQLALPATSAVLDERVQKVQSLVNDVKQRGSEFMSSVFTLQSSLRSRPVKMDPAVPDLSKTLERTLPQFGTAIGMNVSALSDLLDMYCSTLTGPTVTTPSPAPVQPYLPTTGDPYEDANGRLEEMRRKYHALQDEAGSLLVEVMMDDERRMPPQLLVKMPTPIADMTENFFRNSIDLHQSWSSNPVLLIRELHHALGLKRTAPLRTE